MGRAPAISRSHAIISLQNGVHHCSKLRRGVMGSRSRSPLVSPRAAGFRLLHLAQQSPPAFISLNTHHGRKRQYDGLITENSAALPEKASSSRCLFAGWNHSLLSPGQSCTLAIECRAPPAGVPTLGSLEPLELALQAGMILSQLEASVLDNAFLCLGHQDCDIALGFAEQFWLLD